MANDSIGAMPVASLSLRRAVVLVAGETVTCVGDLYFQRATEQGDVRRDDDPGEPHGCPVTDGSAARGKGRGQQGSLSGDLDDRLQRRAVGRCFEVGPSTAAESERKVYRADAQSGHAVNIGDRGEFAKLMVAPP